MRLEDRGLLRLLFLPQTFDGREQDLGDSDERRLRLALLLCDRAGLIRREIAVEVLPCEHDLADGNPGDDAFSTDCFRHIQHPPY